MVFFNFGYDLQGNKTFMVSPKIWMFFAITIPCTCIIMLVYQVWRWKRGSRMVRRRQPPPGELETWTGIPLAPIQPLSQRIETV
jgi:uncharacterized membrane protein YidH (DUF202 family)